VTQEHVERYVLFDEQDGQTALGVVPAQQPGQVGRLAGVEAGAGFDEQQEAGLRRPGPIAGSGC
jgi:hypothetical protein